MKRAQKTKPRLLPLPQPIHYERVVPPKAKQQPVDALLPAHPPREEEVIEPEGLEEGMKKMGEEVTEILEHIPGKLYVRRIIRPK
ncbi:MAG: IS66 family transposase zinc-finger binding domain-containing protein [Bacteroidota bacterium]